DRLVDQDHRQRARHRAEHPPAAVLVGDARAAHADGFGAAPPTLESRASRGYSSTAPIRKPSAPSAVAPFATCADTGSCVEGWISEATAETPKAIEPSRFTSPIHQSRVRGPSASQRPHTTEK